jgi:hypothetical protein
MEWANKKLKSVFYFVPQIRFQTTWEMNHLDSVNLSLLP